jgi:anhydro-N-acetylmuramic acid kinase
MSGTSADGIDAVVAQFSRPGGRLQAKIVSHLHRPFREAFRQRILHSALNGTVAEICELNFELGEHFAETALRVIRKAVLKPSQILAIASHGQTLHHLPNARYPSTLQIGEPTVIAERTGIPTIANFRVRDMAAGGEGAPLVPYADWVLFTDPVKPRIIQNIGGIANLTFLPPCAKSTEVLAFDTGPGNMIIDAVTAALSEGRQTMDTNGRRAARGTVSAELLKVMLAHPFLRRRPPKTTGREEFGEEYVQEILSKARQLRVRTDDLIATVTAFTATTIAEAYCRFVFPKISASNMASLQIVLGGGGAKNRALRQMLAARLPEGKILTHEDLGIDNSAKEALAFAILGYETLCSRPTNLPQVTGARHPVILGTLVPA